MFTLFIFFFFLLPPSLLSSSLLSSSSSPILTSISNCQQLSKYTFAFIPETTVPIGGKLLITFPNQFIEGLGISTATPVCSDSCTLDKRIVTLAMNRNLFNGTCKIIYNSCR